MFITKVTYGKNHLTVTGKGSSVVESRNNALRQLPASFRFSGKYIIKYTTMESI